MNGYFKPLRRKMGVVMLVLAFVFAAGWVRSFGFQDSFSLDGRRVIAFGSTNGLLSLAVYSRDVTTDAKLVWMSTDRSEPDFVGFDAIEFEWPVNWWGFRYAGPTTNSPGLIATIPYWSIVIPLTLLSSWLLLSKPRTKIEAQIPPTVEKS